jgi:predicted SnoaL-like aldol condensation-catalyzing enzyme
MSSSGSPPEHGKTAERRTILDAIPAIGWYKLPDGSNEFGNHRRYSYRRKRGSTIAMSAARGLSRILGGSSMSRATEQNKRLVLEAFDTLFNKRDYAAAEKFWSPHYVQHSAHIEPGREGLFNLVKTLPPTLKYEPGTIVADGDVVIVHGRFSGFQRVNWIAADILRVKEEMLVEHWDVIQDEATREESKSKAPMFGTSFPSYPDRTRPA